MKHILTVIAALLVMAGLAAAQAKFTIVTGTETPIGLANPSEVKCHGGLPTGNPFAPCPPGTSGTVRGQQRILQEDTSDARTNGLNYGTFNANIHEAMLVLSGIAWLVLGYVVPWTAVLGRAERPIVATANGTWFIWVVASESVAIAAAVIEPVFVTGRRELALLAVMSWSVGVFLYAAAGLFVSLRLMLYEFGPEELTPPYWVSMGALAITVLAGARIVEMADAPMVHATRELIAGLAVVFWAFATWLIPVLVAAGWWRHIVRRVPLRYEATLWSIVFPLGIYAVAGIYLGQADRLPVVGMIGRVELWVALTAWAIVFHARS